MELIMGVKNGAVIVGPLCIYTRL